MLMYSDSIKLSPMMWNEQLLSLSQIVPIWPKIATKAIKICCCAYYTDEKEVKKERKKIVIGRIRTPTPERWKKMTPQPARPRRLHMLYVKNCSSHLDGPRDFPVCILKSFTFLKLPFNYLSFGTIFISCNFCFRLHCLLDQRVGQRI